MRSVHQIRVDEFMKLAGQDLPQIPTVPSLEIRRLRARLILEESLETINALGFKVVEVGPDELVLIGEVPDEDIDLNEIADGCADVSVVTIGTLSACGISDVSLLEEVDKNNLAKFGPGHSKDQYGKLVKPPGHRPPDIAKVLKNQKHLHELAEKYRFACEEEQATYAAKLHDTDINNRPGPTGEYKEYDYFQQFPIGSGLTPEIFKIEDYRDKATDSLSVDVSTSLDMPFTEQITLVGNTKHWENFAPVEYLPHVPGSNEMFREYEELSRENAEKNNDPTWIDSDIGYYRG